MSLSVAEIRLECLKLALSRHPGVVAPPDLVISDARQFSDMVLGTNDAEIIRAARDLAQKVGG